MYAEWKHVRSQKWEKTYRFDSVVKEVSSKPVDTFWNIWEMKPLENSRRTLVWMGVHFTDDDPVSWRLQLAQKTFAITFAIIFIAFSTLHVITFLKLRFINPEEFFFALLQFIMTVQTTTFFITIYLFSSRISTVFQCLTQIYKKFKQNNVFYSKVLLTNLTDLKKFKTLMNAWQY